MHQSRFRFSVQLRKRRRMKSGCHAIRSPASTSSCLCSRILHEPLPGGDELERAVPLLEELHRVLERLRLATSGAALAAGAAAGGSRSSSTIAFCASLTVWPASCA